MKSIGIYLCILTLLAISAGRVNAQYIDTVCIGDKGVHYFAQPNAGSTYLWTVQDGLIVNSTPDGSEIWVDWGNVGGVKKITLTEITVNGCWSKPVQALVLMKPVGTVDILGPDLICSGETVQLKALGADTYLWSTGETGDVVTVRPNYDTTYSVTGFFDECGTTTSLHDLRVRYKPIADFTFNPDKPIINTPIQFNYTGTNNVDDWYWRFNETNKTASSTQINPIHTMQDAGVLAVHLTVKNDFGCMDSITKYIVVEAGINVFVPTGFTPNDDGFNNVFLPVYENIASVELKIMDRWGEIMFATTSLDNGWDGRYKGVPVPDGVFVYLIQAKGMDNKSYVFRGTVTVLR